MGRDQLCKQTKSSSYRVSEFFDSSSPKKNYVIIKTKRKENCENKKKRERIYIHTSRSAVHSQFFPQDRSENRHAILWINDTGEREIRS